MARNPVNKTPTRKTLQTGETLPAVETKYRPIPVGYDEYGEVDGQVRAFAILIRNRADSPVFIREGPSDDENRIDPGESFRIWEPDGVNDVAVRGANGGETVEFRTLEAHNDFDITDQIDAFIRSVSHFFGTSRRQSNVTISDVDGDVTVPVGGTVDAVIDGTNVTIPVSGDVDANISGSDVDVPVTGSVDAVISGSEVELDVTGTVDIQNINDGIQLTGADADIPVTGDVDANITNSDLDVSVPGGVDANITNSQITVTGGVDAFIDGQADFDLSAFNRQGRRSIVEFDGNYSAGHVADQGGIIVVAGDYYHDIFRDPATYDGRIERAVFRIWNYSSIESIGFRIKIDDGDTSTNWTDAAPRGTWRIEYAKQFGGDNVRRPRYYPSQEAVIVWEPDNPPTFEAGDRVAAVIGPHGTTAGIGNYNMELDIEVTDLENNG